MCPDAMAGYPKIAALHKQVRAKHHQAGLHPRKDPNSVKNSRLVSNKVLYLTTPAPKKQRNSCSIYSNYLLPEGRKRGPPQDDINPKKQTLSKQTKQVTQKQTAWAPSLPAGHSTSSDAGLSQESQTLSFSKRPCRLGLDFSPSDRWIPDAGSFLPGS